MKYEDMMKVLEHIQAYVPSKETERELIIPNQHGPDSVLKFADRKHEMKIVGRGQLTAARIRGSQRIQGNSDKSEERFDGLLPVSGDWHGSVCLMEVRILNLEYISITTYF